MRRHLPTSVPQLPVSLFRNSHCKTGFLRSRSTYKKHISMYVYIYELKNIYGSVYNCFVPAILISVVFPNLSTYLHSGLLRISVHYVFSFPHILAVFLYSYSDQKHLFLLVKGRTWDHNVLTTFTISTSSKKNAPGSWRTRAALSHSRSYIRQT